MRVRKLLLVIVAIGILGWIAFVIDRNQAKSIISLQDGSTISLLGTAVGRNTFTTEKPWHKQASRLLPARFQHWIPSPVVSHCSSSSNSFTVYIEHVVGTGTPWSYAAAVADDGFQYQMEGGFCSSGNGKRTVYGIILRGFPRRQREFDLTLFDSNRAPLGRLRVQNPFRGPFPKWKAHKVPAAQSNGPVVLTLLGLKEQSTRFSTYVKPEWSIESADPRWKRAKIDRWTFSDPTDNEGSILRFDEPAWKLRLDAHRTQMEDFDPHERLTLTNLTVPSDGKFSALNVAAERDGIQFLVQALAGPGTLCITNGTNFGMPPIGSGSGSSWSTSSDGKTTVEEWGSAQPSFLVEITGVDSNPRINFRLTSDTGREIPLDESSGGYTRSGRANTLVYHKKFTPPIGTRIVHLDISVSRPLEFEFVIDPRDIRRAANAKP